MSGDNNTGESDTLVLDGRTVRLHHAPGEWRVQVFRDRRGRSITKVIADECHICTVDYTAARTALGQLCPEYLDGNALLIAAAPRLLAACIHYAKDKSINGELARAAIAQAAGEDTI